jgi:hypothetical protein
VWLLTFHLRGIAGRVISYVTAGTAAASFEARIPTLLKTIITVIRKKLE